MKVFTLRRLAAVISLLAVLLQFPIAKVKVARELKGITDLTSFEISALQLTAFAYHANKKVAKWVFQTALAPGMIGRDLQNKLLCEHLGRTDLCGKAPNMDRYDDIFEMTEPMYHPRIIDRSIQRVFRDQKEVLLATSSLTVGAAVLTVVVPAKIGFFGYLLLLYCCVRAGCELTPYAYMYACIFLVATDVLSFLRAGTRARAPRMAAPATAAVQEAAEVPTDKKNT